MICFSFSRPPVVVGTEEESVGVLSISVAVLYDELLNVPRIALLSTVLVTVAVTTAATAAVVFFFLMRVLLRLLPQRQL